MFSFRRNVQPEVPFDYSAALAIARNVQYVRETQVLLRDSDGNAVRLKYPDGTVEEAAMIASAAPNLPASINAMERCFAAAEVRISSAIQTS